MKYPLKLIEWEDAFSGDHDWGRIDNLKPPEPHLIYSTGFELQRTDTHVTLAMSIGPNNCSDLLTLPLRYIVREKTLRSRL